MTLHERLSEPHRLQGHHLGRVVIICVVALIALAAYCDRAHGQELTQGVHTTGSILRAPAVSVPSVSQRTDAPRPASTSSLTWLTVALAGTAGADVYLTTSCVSSGRCAEIGSYRGVASSRWQMGTIKAAGTGSLAYLAWRNRKTHPKAATWMLVSLVAGQTGIVLWNAHQVTR